jgi:hypothetical protein
VRNRWSATSQRLLPALIGMVAFAALTVRVFNPGEQLFYRDTGRLIYPVKKYIADRLGHASLPLWDPWTAAGSSLLQQVWPGLLHPWTLLYVIGLPFDLAFKLNHLLPLLLAGVGLYLLARRLGASRTGAMVGGFVFGASGYLTSMAAVNLNYLVGPAGVPIALERFLAFLDRPSRGRLLAASALLALCAYAGEPQSMLLGGLIGGGFAVARALSRRRGLAGAVLSVAAWGGLALALSAPVALPAAAQVAQRSKGLERSELERFAESPRRLPGLIIPGGFDDNPELVGALDESRQGSPFFEYFGSAPFAPSIYLGSGALLLAAFALLAGRRGRFFVLGAVCLLIASTGEILGLQPILMRLIPGFALFRYAEKLIAFASLLFAVAAALGLDEAFLSVRRMRALAALSALFALACGCALALIAQRPEQVRDWLTSEGARHAPWLADYFVAGLLPGLRQEAELAAILAAAALATSLRPLFPGRAVAAGVCGTALILSGSQQLTTAPIEFYREEPLLARDMLRTAGPSVGRWRMFVQLEGSIEMPSQLDPKLAAGFTTREALRPRFNSLYGIESVSEYSSFIEPRYQTLLAHAAREAFFLLGARFFVAMPEAMDPSRAASLGFERTHHGLWLQTLPAGPRARLLDRVETAPDERALAARLTQVDFARTAIFLPGEAPALNAARPGPSTAGAALLRRPSPEHIAVEVNAATDAVLEVGEHYDAGWRVRVDGKPAAPLAVDGALLGAVVPAGRHSVELRFIPTGLIPGLVAAGVALLLLWVTKHVRALTISVTGRD